LHISQKVVVGLSGKLTTDTKDSQMKPTITFECTNEDCEKFGKEIQLQCYSFFGSLQDDYREDYWTAKLKHCRKCYRVGKVEIKYAERTFSELDAFEEYIVGLAKEARLLKKLVERGVAEDDEKRQFDESMKLLHGTKCPCCGQPLIDTIEKEPRAQQSAPPDADKPRR